MKKILTILFLIMSIVSFGRDLKAPEFNLKDQYGVEHSLEKYRGKVVVLNFWTTWCPVCKEEIKDIEKLYEDYGKNQEDVVFLGVSNENMDKIKSYVEKNNYKFPTVVGEDVMRDYFIRAFPTVFIIDKNGNVFKYGVGAVSPEILKNVIKEASENSN